MRKKIEQNYNRGALFGITQMVGGALLLLGGLLLISGCPNTISSTAGGGVSPLASNTDADNDQIVDTEDIDDDNDGLIEIDNLDMLNNMRYDLYGASYRTSADSTTTGCPTTGCNGYELMRDLDFSDPGSYASGVINSAWRPNSSNPDTAINVGWEPIGIGSSSTSTTLNQFNGIFEGNHHIIINLYMRAPNAGSYSYSYVGLFGGVGYYAKIRNVGIVDYDIYEGAGLDYIGGLAAQSNGTIIDSYAAGRIDSDGAPDNTISYNYIGGLVGENRGSVIASYADTHVTGGNGTAEYLGGLVGYNSGAITASYATGDIDSGIDDPASVDTEHLGGLVGNNTNTGAITASYATGSISGSVGDNSFDYVGGLVGQNNGTVSASYSTGEVAGSTDNTDYVGALVGYNSGTVDISYTSGDAPYGNSDYAAGYAVTVETLLAGVNSNSDPATPFYRWADFADGQWVATTAAEKARVYCDRDGNGTIDGSEISGSNYIWNFGTSTELPVITCSPENIENQFVANGSADIDVDDDGLIEINDLDMLHNMRYNLDGTSYKSGTGDSGSVHGCPLTGCNGYELMRDLDFSDPNSYADGVINTLWIPNNSNPDNATNSGWPPIGDTNQFNAIFEGNNHIIDNLYVRTDNYIGLFGTTEYSAQIRNIGVTNLNLYDTYSNGENTYSGGLVGKSIGAISDSYTTGRILSAVSSNSIYIPTYSYIGGLAGEGRGAITASYSTVYVVGSAGLTEYVGGLVGLLSGTISSSYATGNVDNGISSNPSAIADIDYIGGLVGGNNGTISSSYATGNAASGISDHSQDYIGGLVGRNYGTVATSYATGNASGSGAKTIDYVGKLIGYEDANSTTSASYASGSTDQGSTEFSAGYSVNVDALQSGVNTDTDDGTPFYRWTADGQWQPTSASEKQRVYCDVNNNGVIDSSEAVSDNYVWNFGASSQLPIIMCTPDHIDNIANGSADIDIDNDGLIEINNLDMLNNIRYNLDGTSYTTNESSSGSTHGCPTTGCNGYELTRDLDFNSISSYDDDSPYPTIWQPDNDDPSAAKNAGWMPIGENVVISHWGNPDTTIGFRGAFEGNSHTISNLYIRREGYIGLFTMTHSTARIQNIGLRYNAIYAVYADNVDSKVGGIVGYNGGVIHRVYSISGKSSGSSGDDWIGGLAGQNAGIINASYTTGTVVGADGTDSAGGITGKNVGVLTACYATGAIGGNDGYQDRVGGLIGFNGTSTHVMDGIESGAVYSSYATGDIYGGDGDEDVVGGLVGWFGDSVVVGSYTTGNVDGGLGNNNFVGRIAGFNGVEGYVVGTTEVSYASGVLYNIGSVEGKVGYAVTLDALLSGVNSNEDPAIPFYHWAPLEDAHWEPETNAEKLRVYCDTNGNNTIEASEANSANYIWEFGTEQELPTINCTPR